MSGDNTKDLAYYQANPDELADLSLEEIEALGVVASEEGDTASGKAPEAATDKDGKAGQHQEQGESAADSAADSAAEGDQDADGVLAKDGKNVLPFSVLQGARERAAILERMVEDQKAELERLRGERASEEGTTGKPAAGEPDEGEAGELSEDVMQVVEQEFPALAKILRAQQNELSSLREERMARNAAQASEIADKVQSIIDAKPKLAHLQANDPDAWRELVEHDNRLAASPKWRGKSLSDRFDAALRIYEAENGEVSLPQTGAKKAHHTTQLAGPSLDTPAAASRRGPTTLSDLPGGKPAPVDELASIEQASAVELTARFEAMTPEQLEAFIARSGG